MIWSSDIEYILEQIRSNSMTMSNMHKRRYTELKSILKYFRIPTIIFSACNVFASVGLQPYLQQGYISLITCGVSLITGIITSIELFIGIQSSMEVELNSSKDFYILAIDIFRMLSLTAENRGIDGRTYLDEKYQIYCKLIETSDIITKRMKENLIPIVRDFIPNSTSQISSIPTTPQNSEVSDP
jgi:hypothetical protein